MAGVLQAVSRSNMQFNSSDAAGESLQATLRGGRLRANYSHGTRCAAGRSSAGDYIYCLLATWYGALRIPLPVASIARRDTRWTSMRALALGLKAVVSLGFSERAEVLPRTQRA